MKAKDFNGSIRTWRRLPKTYKSATKYYTAFDKASKDIIEAEGFYDVVTPSYDSVTQQISNLHFDGSVFTYDVTDKVFSQTLEQAKETKKQEVKAMAYKLLQPTDWYGIRLAINGIALPENITDERNEIIRKSDIAEVEIDALQTIPEVLKYQIVLVEPVGPLI